MRRKKAINYLMDIILVPVVLVLLWMYGLFGIRFWRLRSGRIGHLVLHVDLLLRRIQLGTISGKHILIASHDISNHQLMKMFKRKIKIITFYQPRIIRAILHFICNNSILRKTGLYKELSIKENYYEYNNSRPYLFFTPEEERNGKAILDRMGINSWYICFHARDSSYLDDRWKKGSSTDSRNVNRNSNINNYLEAATYIANKGGYAVRMGAIVNKPLSEDLHPNIIDYSSLYRSEFADIYLPKECKFFLGNTSGITHIALLFQRPYILTNIIPFATIHFPHTKESLFIPKKMWSIKEKRFLTFKEMLKLSNTFNIKGDLTKAGLQAVENTSKEIFDITKEMNERLDGTWKIKEVDEVLQKKFRSLFPLDFPARIGAKFLKENKHLL